MKKVNWPTLMYWSTPVVIFVTVLLAAPARPLPPGDARFVAALAAMFAAATLLTALALAGCKTIARQYLLQASGRKAQVEEQRERANKAEKRAEEWRSAATAVEDQAAELRKDVAAEQHAAASWMQRAQERETAAVRLQRELEESQAAVDRGVRVLELRQSVIEGQAARIAQLELVVSTLERNLDGNVRVVEAVKELNTRMLEGLLSLRQEGYTLPGRPSDNGAPEPEGPVLPPEVRTALDRRYRPGSRRWFEVAEWAARQRDTIDEADEEGVAQLVRRIERGPSPEDFGV